MVTGALDAPLALGEPRSMLTPALLSCLVVRS